MREVKFRAWDKANKAFMSLGLHIKDHEVYIDPGNHINGSNFVDLQQFTGLLDKNGLEIYEGDIIKDAGGALGEVRWRHSGFEQYMLNTTGWWVIQEQGKVIGNIYENPELLHEQE